MEDIFSGVIEALYACKIEMMDALLAKNAFEHKTLSLIVKRPIFRGKNIIGSGAKPATMISPECIKTLKFTPSLCATIGIDECEMQNQWVFGGDIVFVLGGEHAGASAIIPIFSEGGAIDSLCAGIVIDGSIANPFYVVHVLHWWYRKGFFLKIFDGSGCISIDDLEVLEIPLPPLEIQQKISNALLEISGVIERLKEH
jgi:hypothetical protein